MEMSTQALNAAPVAANSGVGVTQMGITPNRSGLYTGMTTMTSELVQQKGLEVLWVCDLPGDWRGSEHSGLVVPNVKQRDGTTCSIMLAISMSNDVWCFDYDKPDPVTGRGRLIWKQRIGQPAHNDIAHDMYLVNAPFWGGLSCPIIDVATGTLYACILSTTDGTFATGRYYLHAIDIVTGMAKAAPLDITTAVYQSPGGAIRHDASLRKQRAGLGFWTYDDHDVIFICDSTFDMMGITAHGFITACDVTGIRVGGSMSIACCWTASAPPYAGAGIWMAGGAPAFNRDGSFFVVGANGAFDPSKGCFGNAAVHLQYTPATATAPASIAPLEWWCGYTDAGRSGYDPTIPWIGLIPGFKSQQDGMDMTAKYDQDLGCAQGALCLKEETGFTDDLFVTCGKDGIATGLIVGKFGNTAIGDFAPDKIQANYAKAAFITCGTYYPGAFDITPTNLGTMSTTVDGMTHHQHSEPPRYMSPDHGFLIYFGGENSPIQCFAITQDATTKKYACTFVANSHEIASAGVPAPGGMPGTFMSISQVGTGPNNTAILFANSPINGDGNKGVVDGRLVAYGANWVDGNLKLIKLWASTDWGIAFTHAKFSPPHPALDKVSVDTYSAQILVFGVSV